MDLVWTV